MGGGLFIRRPEVNGSVSYVDDAVPIESLLGTVSSQTKPTSGLDSFPDSGARVVLEVRF